MRSNNNANTANAAEKRDLEDGVDPTADPSDMTSRGTKYWNSGAIPLIAPEILGDIITEVADIGIVISDIGDVLSVLVNPTHDSFRKLERWEGRDIRTAMTSESISKFDKRLAAYLAGEKNLRPVELNHSDETSSWEFPVRYSFHRIGPDGAILMLGRDLRQVAEMQQQLVKAQLMLEQDYEAQRENDTRFRVLMESSTQAVIFVSAFDGQVVEANTAAATLFEKSTDTMIGTKLGNVLATASGADLVGQLSNHSMGDTPSPMTATIEHSNVNIVIRPTLFRAAGERLLLCRITPQGHSDVAADALNDHLRGVYDAGPDGMVFTTDTGAILSANEGFLHLIDTAPGISQRGANLADYLQRGSVDIKVMVENASRGGKMRLYATRVAGDYGRPRVVDISVTKINAGPSDVYAFVLREAGRTEASRSGAHSTEAETGMRSVKELVGSASLKDIVAETTNVVEKMCIETAVELTMNNRVAAAEMLGLSRQSLYVKLRKFNLLSRDGEGN